MSAPMKMLVWTDHHSFLVVAHSDSVEAGRRIALAELGATDGSCPKRAEAVEFVLAYAPTIWVGEAADYAIEEKYVGDEGVEPGVTHFS